MWQASGELKWGPKDVADKQIHVRIIADGAKESLEYFELELHTASGGEHTAHLLTRGLDHLLVFTIGLSPCLPIRAL